jgi:type I restriction enzyme R subunit
MELILELQSDDFWEGVTLPMLENVRRRLRSLVQFLDQEGGRQKVYTDFEDEIGTVTDVPWTGYQINDFRNYRLKVERFVREHQTHVTIHRLKHNQPIHAADIEALESILFSEGGPCSRVEFVATYGTDTPLGKLVREIVGLDRDAAQEAFAEFLTRGNLTADQMTFIGQIIDHLVHNGGMDPNLLFGPPFTDFHDNGVVGVLPQDAQAIVRTIQTINNNALVA